MYESGNELVVECGTNKCTFICPKCGESRDVTNFIPNQVVHCCEKKGKTQQCYRIKGDKLV